MPVALAVIYQQFQDQRVSQFEEPKPPMAVGSESEERILVKNLPPNSTEGSVRQLFGTYAGVAGEGLNRRKGVFQDESLQQTDLVGIR